MWSSENDVILSAATYYMENKKATSLLSPKNNNNPKQFQLPPGDSISKNCGKIFITINRLLIFHCTFCDKKYGTLFNFLQHISSTHLSFQNKIKKPKVNGKKAKPLLGPFKKLEPVQFVSLGQQFVKGTLSQYTQKTKKKVGINRKISKEEIIQETSKKAEKEPEDLASKIEHDDEASISSLEDLDITTDSKSFQFHKCTKCEKGFVKKSSLKIHILSHSNIKNYKCPKCEKTFKYENSLRLHMVRHAEKKHKCEICDMRFFHRSEVRQHQRSHSDERKFVCWQCGNSYKSSSHLTIHMKRHNSIPSKKCDICEKTFWSNGQLKKHMAVHSSERPFACPQCSASFARKNTLREHMKLHSNDKVYACDLCEMSFNQLPALISHKTNRHKVLK